MCDVHAAIGNELDHGLESVRQQLLPELNRSIKRCEIGESLGVLAKVESQMGSRDNSLNLIAGQISQTIEEIQGTLKNAASVISK